jgi:hypothetical protein
MRLTSTRSCARTFSRKVQSIVIFLCASTPIGATSLRAGRATGGSGGGARPASGDMTVEEAYAILGLAPGADAEAIKEAHRRLMVKLHPDHCGSNYLATKITRARDVLLHH